MVFTKAHIHPPAYVLPPRVISSADIEERLHTVYERLKLPAGRLELMSGIRERRFWEKGTRPSEAAAKAGRVALDNSGLGPQDIDCLIFTSVSRDMMEPATAAFVHRLLGLGEHCLVFDLSNACLGFLNGMILVANMIDQGQISRALLVAGETAEDLVESTITALLASDDLTRKSIKSYFASFTIGSGCVAMVMDDGGNGMSHRLIGGAYRANTRHNELCQGGKSGRDGTLMLTDSEELLKRGVETAHNTWNHFLRALQWEKESIARFFCHQVGRAHAGLLFETLGLDQEKNFETLHFLGNVGSVSAPITLAFGVEQNLLQPGDRAAILGIGSGINCLMLGIEW